MPKNLKVQPTIGTVNGTSEFEFEVTVSGTWDWNKMIAGAPGSESSLVGYNPSEDIVVALQNAVAASMIFGTIPGAEEVRLTRADLKPEMVTVWNKYRAELKDADRQRLEGELAELEKKTAAVKARLGRQ